MTMQRSKTNLLEGPELRGILLFALPIMGSSLFQKLYNTADTMIVGNFLGENSLAAMGAASPVYILMIGLALGMGNGISIIIGRCYGQRDPLLLRRAVGHSLVIAALLGLILTGVSQVFSRPLLRLLNTPESIIGEADGYIRTITAFILVTFLYNLCSGVLRSVGNSLIPLVALIISSVLNIALDILFIARFGLGVRGAAIATVISQSVSVVFCLWYIAMYARFLIPKGRDLRLTKALASEIVSNGLSMGLMECLIEVGSLVLQYGINGMGETIIAAHTTARKIFVLCNIPVLGVASAAATFISQNRGADRPDRIRRGVREVTLYNLAVTVVLTIALYFLGRPLIAVTSGSHDETLIYWGSQYVQWVAPFYFMLGELFLFRYAVQTLGNKLMQPLSSGIEMGTKFAFAALLIPSFGYRAVIFCEPFAWCLMDIMLAAVFYAHPYIKSAKTSK